MPKLLSIDNETLGLGADAVLLSTGLALAVDGEITECIEIYHNLDDQFRPGPHQRYVTASTFFWWMENESELRLSQTNADRPDSLHESVHQLHSWLTKHVDADTLVYANSPSFDLAQLQLLFRQHGLPLPWAYWNERDYRTMKNEYRNVPWPKKNSHNALDDAINQLEHLLAIQDFKLARGHVTA